MVELVVQRLYARANADLENPPGAGQLAVSIFGENCLGYGQQSEPWRLVQADDGRWQIFLRRSLSRPDLALGIACGLAKWAIHTKLVRAVPFLFDLAGGILSPEPALQRFVHNGCTAEEIATALVCPLRIVKARMAVLCHVPTRSGLYVKTERAAGIK